MFSPFPSSFFTPSRGTSDTSQLIYHASTVLQYVRCASANVSAAMPSVLICRIVQGVDFIYKITVYHDLLFESFGDV